MLKSLSTKFIQHILTQNTWAGGLLKPHAGKSVQFNVAFFKTALVILENGSLAVAGETNVADATVFISPSLLARLLAKDEAAKQKIRIEGDTHLATEMAKILSHLHWDIEDDLSKVVGDLPATQLATFVKKNANSTKESIINIAEMLGEYWQEEHPLIAKKFRVEQFNQDVDVLRADVERFEKKLDKLLKATQTDPAHHAIDSTP